MNKKYYIVYLIATAILAAALFWGIYSPSHTSLLTTTPAPAKTGTTITLVAGTSTYALPFRTNESVLDAMRQAAASSSFAFTGSDYPGLGFFVDSINGVQSAHDMYWFLYVNGTSSDTGASQTLLHPGDVVEWKYERSH